MYQIYKKYTSKKIHLISSHKTIKEARKVLLEINLSKGWSSWIVCPVATAAVADVNSKLAKISVKDIYKKLRIVYKPSKAVREYQPGFRS